MRLTSPRAVVRVGDVEIRSVQQVLELDALESACFDNTSLPQYQQRKQNTTHGVPPSAIHAIQSRTAIVVPCKGESLSRIRGVWAAIPASSLIILVSGSDHDAYNSERDAMEEFCRQTGRNGIAVHQRDPKVAAALRAVGMKALLNDDDDGLVHEGKGEALVIGTALAATARQLPGSHGEGEGEGGGGGGGNDTRKHATRVPCGLGQQGNMMRGEARCGSGYRRETTHGNVQQCACNEQQDRDYGTCHNCRGAKSHNTNPHGGYYKYIGFVDADNYAPGSVQEYCRAFSAGLHLARGTEDAMVRISWASKPKIHDGKLEFRPLGRSSEIVNRWLNSLLTNMNGADVDTGGAFAADSETNLICTGNAGEHAMTISLALKLRLASGYAIEPFHFLDIWERFAFGEKGVGLDPTVTTTAGQGGLGGQGIPAADFATRLPSSPMVISPLTSSPATTPVDCSPLLSASEDSTLPTSPSVLSSGQTLSSRVPACQLPPPLTTTCLDYQRAAPNDMDTPPDSPTSAPARILVLQIRTLNPHFHESRGEEHVLSMWKQGLSSIYHSPITTWAASPALAQWREDLRSVLFASGRKGNLPTPPLSNRVSVASTPEYAEYGPLAGAGDFVNDQVVLAAAEWQPERCRIYPPAISMGLEEFRSQLEKGGSGSFWWGGKDDPGPSYDPGLGFDEVAVLGLGPVSREKRPEGDVDGFKAFVDGSMDGAEAPGALQSRTCASF